MSSSRPVVVGIDAGGTMTDTILVDENGVFNIGKAATTPDNEADGFLESAIEAAVNRDMTVEDMFNSVDVVLYSGTGMLNVLLSYTGRKLGLITTRGIEDMVLMGRGLQAWSDYSYADRLHAVTHRHPRPLVDRSNTLGVTERIDHMGDIVIPLYEHEAVEAARLLIERGVEAICICMLFSHVNPEHEQRVETIVREEVTRSGMKVDIYASHAVRPVVREQSRLNSVLIEAYATGKGRKQLLGIDSVARCHGYRNHVQTLQSFGGLASVYHPYLHETMVSGPIGGILGARYIGNIIGTDSIVVSDLGGTSFDMGIITRGQVRIENEPLMGRFKLNLPMIAMDTIGAGAGMHVRVDPLTRKVSLGPESAGSDPGPVCFGNGNLEPTVCDCDAILGRLNPEYFLGGKVRLDVDLARETFREKCVSKLGIDNIYDAAEGMLTMLESEAQSALLRILSAQGIHPSEYALMSYGGSGPLHLGGYSRDIGFRDILTFKFAAAFSAFGCTTADYQKRFSRSVRIEIGNEADTDSMADQCRMISSTWKILGRTAIEELTADGHDRDTISCQPLLLMRYAGQLEDVEILSPVEDAGSADDLRQIISKFRKTYRQINRSVSDYGQESIAIMELGMIASVDKIKPRLVKGKLESPVPAKSANKGDRMVYFGGTWLKSALWEMDELQPGNRIAGPAIIEHPATTLVVHPGDRVFLDEWSIIHYHHGNDHAPAAGLRQGNGTLINGGMS